MEKCFTCRRQLKEKVRDRGQIRLVARARRRWLRQKRSELRKMTSMNILELTSQERST